MNYGEETARLEYRLRSSMIVYAHTVVPPALERRGIAGRLAKEVLDCAPGQQTVSRGPKPIRRRLHREASASGLPLCGGRLRLAAPARRQLSIKRKPQLRNESLSDRRPNKPR